jgi:PAS domain S-box-containing protein
MTTGIDKLLKNTGLNVKILLATVIAIGIFTGISLYQNLSLNKKSSLRLVEESSQGLLENTYSAINYPMSLGDSKTIERQLIDVKENMKGIEVYITDFRKNLTYASEESKINTNMTEYLWEEKTKNALTETLRTGISPKQSFSEIRDEDAFLVTIKPLLNESSCHHCHGEREKVLGAIVIKNSIKKVYASLASARNRLITFSIIEIVGITLLMTFLLYRLVTRRIEHLAEKTDQVSAGDMTVEVHDDYKDSIGRLSRNFNQLIINIRNRIRIDNSVRLGIPYPLIMTDSNMKITYINDAAAKLAGVTADAVQGEKLCSEVFKSDVCYTAECPIKKAIETGEATVGYTITMKDPQGKEIPMMTTADALRDSQGKIYGGFELMYDISKEVEAGNQLKDAYHREEKAKEELQRNVETLSNTLRKVAEGDLLARAQIEGENDAMNQLGQRTNDTIGHMKELIGETKKTTNTVVKGARNISEGNQELSERTQQQAANVEETSATLQELVANINHNASSIHRADTLAKEAVAVAIEGGAIVEKTIQSMGSMAEDSRKIVEMTDLINDITFQTNLLSVNAAVEAARAGEQGRGFAVVAKEVRNLAKKSSETSKDTRNLIRDIMNNVDTGKEWIGELNTGFQKIIKSIKEVSNALSEISKATQESSKGLEQIGYAINETSGVIEHNASFVSQIANAAGQLREKADLLQNMTNKFTLGDLAEIEDEDILIEKPKSDFGKERRGTQPLATTHLREDLITQKPIEEKEQDLIEKELEDEFEEF